MAYVVIMWNDGLFFRMSMLPREHCFMYWHLWADQKRWSGFSRMAPTRILLTTYVPLRPCIVMWRSCDWYMTVMCLYTVRLGPLLYTWPPSDSTLTSSRSSDSTTLTVTQRTMYVSLCIFSTSFHSHNNLFNISTPSYLQEGKTALDFGQEADDVKEALLSYRFSPEVVWMCTTCTCTCTCIITCVCVYLSIQGCIEPPKAARGHSVYT